MDNPNAQTIKDLRAVADFLEATPELERFSVMGSLLRHHRHKATFVAQCRALGTFEKKQTPDYISAARSFGTVEVEIFTGRETFCKRVVVEETVPEIRIPATDAEVIPEHVVQRTEWRCPESWLDSEDAPDV